LIECFLCQEFTYSFTPPYTKGDGECSPCMEGGICFGGSKVGIEPGYYRFFANDTVLLHFIFALIIYS
jgi:hypothetical protein